MSRKSFTRAIVASLSLLFVIGAANTSFLQAGRPTGGGGGGTTPAGTIYFSWLLFTTNGVEDGGDWTMTASGSEKQLTPYQDPANYQGARLSHQVHGPARWMLNYGFNPATGRFSLYATSAADGWTILLADGQSMTGADDFYGNAVWAKDDGFVSVVTRDWTDDAAYCHLFRAAVSFDVDGIPSISSDWEWVTSGDLPGRTDIDICDWSRDGTQVALAMVPNNGTLPYINVCDRLTETTTVLATASFNPRYSPAADRIAYKAYNQGIFTVNPDGSGLTQLTTGNGDLPHDWSPNGQYILFGTSAAKSVKGGHSVQVGDVCYVPSAGGKAVNLTGDINGYATPRWWR